MPGILAVVCLALALGGEPLAELLRYDRPGLARHELWRLATGHLVHLGTGHTLMNVVALLILAFLLAGSMGHRAWVGTTVTSALAIDAGLYWLDSAVTWYVGLSGVLHGLLAYGSLELARDGQKVGWLLVAGLVAKIVWEHFFGPLPMSEGTAGGDVVTSAHLFGAIGGVAAFGAAFAFHPRQRRPL